LWYHGDGFQSLPVQARLPSDGKPPWSPNKPFNDTKVVNSTDLVGDISITIVACWWFFLIIMAWIIHRSVGCHRLNTFTLFLPVLLVTNGILVPFSRNINALSAITQSATAHSRAIGFLSLSFTVSCRWGFSWPIVFAGEGRNHRSSFWLFHEIPVAVGYMFYVF
jgi:hypothetical protein